MACRILHCGKSVRNYNICVDEMVAGFIKRVGSAGDIVYFVVTVKDRSICGARGILSQLTDNKPWPDSERYKQCFILKTIEYCEPFDIKILSKFDNQRWYLRYVQGAKTIPDKQIIDLLEQSFTSRKTDSFYRYNNEESYEEQIEILDPAIDVIEEDKSEEITESAEEKISIMGTFQTINFASETDKRHGLELLVNDNFFYLFPVYAEERTILIKDNRQYLSVGLDKKDTADSMISGIRGIPDALLIHFNKDDKCPFQINLIEYECYGVQKVRTIDKSNYLNGHIIPQLMRFASTFSIVTDRKIREDTVEKWTNKIVSYVYANQDDQNKITSWIREIETNVNEQLIGLKIKDNLAKAFKNNIRIMLVIDDLSTEQKDTLTNVVNAFKLENGEGIKFIGYVVRFEQKINLLDSKAEYALSMQ